MFEDFNLESKDKKYLILIVLFSTIIVGYYISFNTHIGTYCSDVYLYLLNALYFTGENIHYPENIYLSPTICFLTSILFRVGLIDKIAIFIVTGILAIIGNIGLYLLLKRYFSENLSLAGTVLYSTFSLYLTWLANGSLDIPAVSMTIWIALIGIIAVKDNPKFYRYIFLLLAIGFYTRYTTMLILPALILYYVYENGFKIKSEERKHIIIGIILGILLFSAITVTIYEMGNGNFLLTEQFTSRVKGEETSAIDPAYNPDMSYYLKNMPNFLSNSKTSFNGNPDLENPTILSWIILAVLGLGSVLWIKDIEFDIKTKITPIAIFIIAILTFSHVSSIITIILIMLGFYFLGKDSDYKTAYFMVCWLLANFIFFSHYDIKVNRYILPAFPPLIYFIIRAINIIHEKLKINKNIIPALLIVLFAVQGFAFTMTFEDTQEFIALEDISDYIISDNPDYKNLKIGAYNMRPYLWYLGYNVTGIESYNPEAIDQSNVTYYISDIKLDNMKNYTEIKQIEQLYLYEKN